MQVDLTLHMQLLGELLLLPPLFYLSFNLKVRLKEERKSVCSAYDRAAIKFRGVEADINFSIEDYEEDLKQVCVRDRFLRCLLNYVIFNSVTLSPTVQSLICRIAFLFFFFFFLFLDIEIYHLQMEVSVIDEQSHQGRVCPRTSPTKHRIS